MVASLPAWLIPHIPRGPEPCRGARPGTLLRGSYFQEGQAAWPAALCPFPGAEGREEEEM